MQKVLYVLAFVLFALDVRSQDLKEFIAANNRFTARVYKELRGLNQGNLCVSPLSVEILFALLHSGAEGRTATQISRTLDLPSTSQEVRNTFSALSAQLRSRQSYDLSNANKIYVKNGFEIADDFERTAQNAFGAEIESVNFEQKSATTTKMNGWIEEKTNGKIRDLINPGFFNRQTSSVLINAIYFRGKWLKQFDKSDTNIRPFRVNAVKRMSIDMMEMTDRFNAYESSELNAKFLEMPYDGDNATMTIVLPNRVTGLSSLESRMADVLATPNYNSELVHVVIPKFAVESVTQFKPVLQSMGIIRAFTDNAEFKKISANRENLKINKLIQKAVIEVDEEGTVAAAASAGSVILLSGSYKPQPVFQFVADHPFIFYIKVKGVVLFVGRYSKPLKEVSNYFSGLDVIRR